jgi:murein DD-endopeptidase MepM/ murein hydrolase activator NlpD
MGRLDSHFVLTGATTALLLALVLVASPARGQGRTFSHRESRELAEELGLGTRMAATLLLNGGFPERWSEAAGGEEPPGYLQWPLPGFPLGRGFGSNGGKHLAVDVTAPAGTAVRSMAPGIVGYADAGIRGYGNTVLLIHSGGWVTLYAHLRELKVEPGARVARGSAIGTVGHTGIARGDHLHFALLVRGKAVDPMKHMRGAPDDRPRLSWLERGLRFWVERLPIRS